MGVITRLFERRSSLATPEKWLTEWFTGGVRSAAGVAVSEQTALQFSAVFACVRVLSETIASLPLPIYRRLNPRGKERAPDHPLYAVLHDQPNPEMTAFTFREALQAHVTTWGNCYAYIVRDGAGRIRELWPLLPNRTWPERDRETGELYYVTTLNSGQTKILRKEDVLHIPGLSFDGLKGYSVISIAREAIGLGMAQQEFGARFFGQGTNIGAVVQHPESLSDKAYERLKQSLRDKYEGIGKSHLLLLLEEGMKFEKIGIPPTDAQFLESRRFQIEDIARWFRMQPHKIQHLDRATFGNIEHQAIEHVVDTIRPWTVRWEQAINMRLLTPAEKKQYFAEHLIDGLLRGDTESRYRSYATARQWGWMSANDVLELENRNPIPDGDIYLTPLNMVPANQAGQQSEVTPAGKEA